MKSKNVAIKTTLSIIAFFLMMFGFLGFMYDMSMSNDSIGKYFDQFPLSQKNGIVADSAGNIYIGEALTGNIQVYNNQGIFQYRFSFPTGGSGWFSFGIYQNRIHIVTARTDSYFVFDRGELIASEKNISNSDFYELQKQFDMANGLSYSNGSKKYRISLQNKVIISDESVGQYAEIQLNAPRWPLPPFVFWLIAAIGMCLMLLLHYKIFLPFIKKKSK